MNKTKILLIGIGSLVAVSAFAFTTLYVNPDEIQSMYLTTTNGSYTRKYIKLQEQVSTSKERAEEEIPKNESGVAAPNDSNASAWEKWVKSAQASETRKNILLEGIDCLNKGVIYHQLRATAQKETPDQCLVTCDHEKYPDAPSYDYKTQAMFNLQDPLYLDCSYFVKHCYSVAGLEMSAANTTGMAGSEFSDIPFSELVPGDIALKAGTHVIMFLGKTSDGQDMFIEMANHSKDMQIAPKTEAELSANGYVYRRFGALASDTSFVGGTEIKETAGTYQIKWDSSWEFANAEMKHPETLNKYIPDNYNGHTVFINPGHGDGNSLESTVPKDPVSNLTNQYVGSATAGHTSGTTYKTSQGKTVTEAQHVLDVASVVKDKLLAEGYTVIMARESLVNNFENSARSVWANNTADIHVAIHIDAGTHGPSWYRPSGKQLAHPNYSKHVSESERLGVAIEDAMASLLGKEKFTGLNGILTGYSYSTIPTTYIEMYGVESKEMADFADSHIEQAAQGIVDGINAYFR